MKSSQNNQERPEESMTWQWKLRVLSYYMVTAIASVVHLIPLIILAAAGANYEMRYYIAKSFSWCFITAIKLICGIDYEVEFLEKLPKGPAIVLSNHQSFWENLIMLQIFPKQSWVIKKELYEIPVFGLGLRLVEPIAVDRSDNASVKQILNMGAEKLIAGLWVIIFPESTRVAPGKRVKLKPSGIKLAQENSVPVVLMVHNAGLYWPKGFWIQRPGMITIKIGHVMHIKQQHDVREKTQEIEDWMNEEKDKLSIGNV